MTTSTLPADPPLNQLGAKLYTDTFSILSTAFESYIADHLDYANQTKESRLSSSKASNIKTLQSLTDSFLRDAKKTADVWYQLSGEDYFFRQLDKRLPK